MRLKYEMVADGEDNRIRALRDLDGVDYGDIGGIVSNEDNLSHDGDCWVEFGAKVLGNARVADNALISGNSEVSQNAVVNGNTLVSESACIYGNSLVSGGFIGGGTHIKGDTVIYGSPTIKSGHIVTGRFDKTPICIAWNRGIVCFDGQKGKINIDGDSFDVKTIHKEIDHLAEMRDICSEDMKDLEFHIEHIKEWMNRYNYL